MFINHLIDKSGRRKTRLERNYSKNIALEKCQKPVALPLSYSSRQFVDTSSFKFTIMIQQSWKRSYKKVSGAALYWSPSSTPPRSRHHSVLCGYEKKAKDAKAYFHLGHHKLSVPESSKGFSAGLHFGADLKRAAKTDNAAKAKIRHQAQHHTPPRPYGYKSQLPTYLEDSANIKRLFGGRLISAHFKLKVHLDIPDPLNAAL
ncbi:hypothetical protein QBC36DRAFT_311332 [Triangularia setosa]|uniref:Uncharacterized protein n=1 Tax=Triangularia setosa TaxID=2587417 RepID=A0AAN6W9V2_9PEZI|nr:hypothetical protein QBC36DRAFT_311332 [Podospora setosa]